MKLIVMVLALIGLLIGVANAGDAPGGATLLTFAQAVEIAQESNPAVQTALFQVEAAEAARRGAGAPVRNPEVSVGAGARLTPGGPQTDVEVSLQVPLNLGGTARHRRVRESAGLEQARAQLRATKLEVAVATRVAFAEAVAADQRLSLTEEAVALGLEVERSARRRYELGEVSLLQPNSAALDRAAAEARRASARGDLAAANQRLRAVLGLPAEQSLGLVVESGSDWPDGRSTDVEILVTQALLARRDLAAAQEGERAASANLRAAHAAGVPGITLGGGWEREGDEADIIGGTVAFAIPLQRNQIGVARAQFGASRAGLKASTLALQVDRDVRTALAVWRGAEERHRMTSGESLVLATTNMQMVLRAYETGEEELLPVLMMQRQALSAREAAIDAAMALQRASAALELALGESLF